MDDFIVDFYDDLNSIECRMDVFTAASLGDISFFVCNKNRECIAKKVTATNKEGWTPLMYACARGHGLVVYYLLQIGASRQCKTKLGVTSLMLAVTSGDKTTVQNVLEVKDIEENDHKKWTALFYAVHFNRQSCVDYLLMKGANANVMDCKNRTPLMIAIQLGYEGMVKLLLEKSAITESVLLLARKSENSKIQKLIFDRYDQLMTFKNPSNYALDIKTTPKKLFLSPKSPNLTPQSPSPSPCKKNPLFKLRFHKSLSYSPNKQFSPVPSPNLGSDDFPFCTLNTLPKKAFMLPNPVEDVESFLKALGLEKYWPIFRNEEVDFETLLTLNEENLKEVGIKRYGPRRKIYLAIQHLKKQLRE